MPRSTVTLLETMRVQAAAHLQTAILHRKLRDLAAVDDLTHLLNRRFGMRRLSEEFSRSIRHGVPLSVLMLDVDNFKTFNDTFGHDAGDAVLVAVAGVLEKGVRSGDVVCRYGGEELLIVAPGMGLADAASAGERFRRLVESAIVEWGGKSLRVTVSVGVTSWPVMRASTPEDLVSAADKALYFAKEAGRNQVALSQGDEVIPLSALVTKGA
jgi:diguanylate cyclase (GGDEF)-like protein